jgi:hypothetical protein
MNLINGNNVDGENASVFSGQSASLLAYDCRLVVSASVQDKPNNFNT